MTTDNRKVVVFCDRYPNPSTVEYVEAIADAHPDWPLTVVRQVTPVSPRAYLRGKLRRLAAEPVSYPLQVLAGLPARLRLPRRRRRADGPVGLPGSPNGVARPNVSYLEVPGLHRKQTLGLVREMKPWLGVSLGAPILKRSLFGIPERGTVNIHKSLLPSYRGVPPGFWELHDGAARSGVSVHWVDEGLDTGALIHQEPLDIPPFSTPAGLSAELDVLGTRVLLEALRLVDAGAAPGAPAHPEAGGAPANRRAPWLRGRKVDRLAWRRRAGSPGPAARLAGLAKDALLAAYLYAFCPVRNAWRGARGRCHASVLLYHRVSDAFLDTVTVGVEQFDGHLATLKRHYDVLDLPTFLEERGRPRHRPCVVLTFDDGYEDNLLAAVLLRRAGLPCTFFVSTRIVGTDRAFPHDLKRLGRRVPSLSWDQVRRMASWGFRFGNHTAHHADLGAAPAGEAAEEVVTAARDLERELGEADGARWLAYPYGKPRHITAELRGRLPELGVRCCLSARGGVNPPDFDEWDVLRMAVDHKFSNLRLRAAVEGWEWSD